MQGLRIKVLSLISLALCSLPLFANPNPDAPFGQMIEIRTHLTSFIGDPVWSLEIRDIDNNQILPYVFDIKRGDNYWVALTYGHNYLIQASRMQFVSYQSRYNTYRNFRIKNFCRIESNGRILRNRSATIYLEGNLSPNSDTYTCHMTTYPTYQTAIRY